MGESDNPGRALSDADIEGWYAEERGKGRKDAEIDRDFIDLMVESFEQILRQRDAARLAEFRRNDGVWYRLTHQGMYAPLSRTRNAPCGSGGE